MSAVSVPAVFLAAASIAAASPVGGERIQQALSSAVLSGKAVVVPYSRHISVLALAQKYSASPHALRRINRLDRGRRRPRPRHILVSSLAIAPRPFPDGVVINLPAFRLFVLRGGEVVRSWPVALGRDFDREWKNATRWRTPIGRFKVRARYWHPDWVVPKDLQKELKRPRERVPFGDPEYPLGEAKIRLSSSGLSIHGTYAPGSIGRMASHGCIRMWNGAITELYSMVRVGTPVALVYAPIQAVEDGSRVWLEVNRDIYGLAGDRHERAQAVLLGSGLAGRADPFLVAKTVAGAPGVAVDVTSAGAGPAAGFGATPSPAATPAPAPVRIGAPATGSAPSGEPPSP